MLQKIKKISKLKVLEFRYKTLIEKAYNFKYTNNSLSDISEYKAMRLLEEINRIKFGY